MFAGDTLHAESEVVAAPVEVATRSGHRHLRAPRVQPARRARVPRAPQRADAPTARMSTWAPGGEPAPCRLRSLLFAPASKPDVLRKMPRSARRRRPRPRGRGTRRRQGRGARAFATSRRRARARIPGPRGLRAVNPVATEWFAADIADGVAPEIAGIDRPEARDSRAARHGGGPSAPPGSPTCTSSPGSRPRGASNGWPRCWSRPSRWRTSAPRTSSPTWAASARRERRRSLRTFAGRAGGAHRRHARHRPGRHRARRRGALPRRRRRRSCHRVPGQALHPPGPGGAGQPRVLVVTRGARPGPSAARRVRRRGRTGRGCHRLRGPDGRRAPRPPRPGRDRRVPRGRRGLSRLPPCPRPPTNSSPRSKTRLRPLEVELAEAWWESNTRSSAAPTSAALTPSRAPGVPRRPAETFARCAARAALGCRRRRSPDPPPARSAARRVRAPPGPGRPPARDRRARDRRRVDVQQLPRHDRRPTRRRQRHRRDPAHERRHRRAPRRVGGVEADRPRGRRPHPRARPATQPGRARARLP